jgi:hypothetical protein
MRSLVGIDEVSKSRWDRQSYTEATLICIAMFLTCFLTFWTLEHALRWEESQERLGEWQNGKIASKVARKLPKKSKAKRML